jgi:hypothetical protein
MSAAQKAALRLHVRTDEVGRLLRSGKLAGAVAASLRPGAAPAYCYWDKRPKIGIDAALEGAGYELLVKGGNKAKCPVCGHTAVNIDHKKRVCFCFKCEKGGHIGSLASQQGKRLA